MKYVDFDVLIEKQKETIFLDQEVAEFLFKTKAKFLPSQSDRFASKKSTRFSIFNSSKFTFSHSLVCSGNNQWHIIENKSRGIGAFGSVYSATFKIMLSCRNAVYSAQLIPVNDVVKIQKVSPGESRTTLRKRTFDEATKQQQHGVRVVAVIGADNKVITVLEDCGISLDKLLPFNPSNKYSFQFRLAMAAHIASGMLLLQQKGIVHRDLKPANICYKKLSEEHFLIFFIDFGLAEDIESKNNLKPSGTPNYMAPEIIKGKGSTYQSDMYALSALLGEIFGATDVLKNKQSVRQRSEFFSTPYCFDGLFTGYDVSEVDPYLLDDIRLLLSRLQSVTPECRPTIEHVNKFLITLPARMDAYKKFNEDWDVMLKHFDQYEGYNQQMDLLKSKHQLIKFKNNLLDEKSPLCNAFTWSMLQKREAIYQQIIALAFPPSHYLLSERLTRANLSADFESNDRPYPDLKMLIQIMEKENLKFERALSSFKESFDLIMDKNQLAEKFINTNSSGILKIADILRSTGSPIEKLKKLQQLGQEKMKKGFFYCFSHSRIIGNGRHQNVEILYQKLADIDPLKEHDDYLAKSQLDSITQFIQQTESFTHF